jgi:hypothetical protein
MIFLSSSNDKEVDVKRDGQGKDAGRVCGAGPTMSEDAGLWHAYAKALEKGRGGASYQRPHYARWVREFMKCAAGRRETRTAPEVSGFPERLHKLPHLQRWQIGQAGAGLALLYEEVLRIGLGKIELPRADASEGPGGDGDRFLERAAGGATARRMRSGGMGHG